MNGVRRGNAAEDGAPYGGWLLGHFVPAGDARRTGDLEVKWGVHPPGDARSAWAPAAGTTLCVLVRGRFVLAFRPAAGDDAGKAADVEEIVLAREGDYALWDARVRHRARAEAPSVTITVRWPSPPERVR